VTARADPAEYIRTHCDNDTYTFNDCYDHLEMMQFHVKSMMRKGNKPNEDNKQVFYPIIQDKSVSWLVCHRY
jgi:hypothetical protein